MKETRNGMVDDGCCCYGCACCVFLVEGRLRHDPVREAKMKLFWRIFKMRPVAIRDFMIEECEIFSSALVVLVKTERSTHCAVVCSPRRYLVVASKFSSQTLDTGIKDGNSWQAWLSRPMKSTKAQREFLTDYLDDMLGPN